MLRHKVTPYLRVAIMLYCLSASAAASAAGGGVGINATRIVFGEGVGQKSVEVRNTSEATPYLISVRLSQQVNGEGKTPFFASPPLFRMEPQSTSSVKISGNGGQLPHDRESVFYFTVTGIPASTPLARGNSQGFVSGGLVFSMGNTIKLFYRPSGLPSNAGQAIKNLTFSKASGRVVAKNASPYYVNLASLKINGQWVKFDPSHPSMVPPFSEVFYVDSKAFPITSAGQVEWNGINDVGGRVNQKGKIQ